MKKSEGQGNRKKQTADSGASPHHPPAHILIVEDDEAHVALIRRGFDAGQEKFRLSFAPMLTDARKIIADDSPALALVDWLLPDGKGADLLPGIDAEPTFPIIIMTSYGNEQLAVELMKAGALDYLVKSDVMFSEIVHTVEGALREWDHIVSRKSADERLRRVNGCLLSLGPDFQRNINNLTALAGELLGGDVALYNRLEGQMLHAVGCWNTPPDFRVRDSANGHICYDVINQGAEGLIHFPCLDETLYADTDPNVRAFRLRTYVGHVVKWGSGPIGSLCVVYRRDYKPTNDDEKILGILSAALGAEETRWRAEEALQKANESLARAQHIAHIGSWENYLPAGELRWSDEMYNILGFPPGTPLKLEEVIRCFPPQELVRFQEAIAMTIKGDAPYSMDYRIIRPDGQVRNIHDEGSVIRDEQGNPVSMFGITQDITDRKRAEDDLRQLNETLDQRVRERTHALEKANEQIKATLDEKVLLLQEIHHRVKNNLQIVASLLNLQARYIKDEKILAAIQESQNRVRAMALVHERLYRSESFEVIDLGDYFRFLTTNLFRFYSANPQRIRLSINSGDTKGGIDQAIPLGLIVNELVSNSLKHAFPSAQSGEIVIRVTQDAGTLTLMISDTGTGIPENFDWQNAQSLGLRLVISLVEQLQGKIDLERENGTKFSITVPRKKPVGTGPTS
jgi:PAS domain S-box-containing protein